jgi:hypothetical protein
MGRYGPNRVIAKLKAGTVVGAPDPKEVMFNDPEGGRDRAPRHEP